MNGGGGLKTWAAGLTMVALATTLVLPGRQTPAVADKTLGGVAKIYNSVLGRG